MQITLLLVGLAAIGLTAAFQRMGALNWAIGSMLWLAGFSLFSAVSWWLLAPLWLMVVLPALLVNVSGLRKRWLSAPMLKLYERITPQISETEQTALESGTVGFEGELFSGHPDFSKLLAQPAPKLSAEEQAFLDGPCEQLGYMINDWEISQQTCGSF
jgi:acyl-CoA dehydrogenase